VNASGRSSWSVEDLPPVDDAGGFSVDTADGLRLEGLVHPANETVVQFAVMIAGSELAPEGDGAANASAAHPSDNSQYECATIRGESVRSPEAGDHEGGSPPARPVAFDVAEVSDAADALVRATSDTDSGAVDRILSCLGVEQAAQLPAAEADGELNEVIAAARSFNLQRFPEDMFISVRNEEPWDFGDSGG
jgi:hypothetical protein